MSIRAGLLFFTLAITPTDRVPHLLPPACSYPQSAARCGGKIVAARWVHRAARVAPAGSGLAEDPVHLGAAHGADPLRHAASVGLVDLTVEVPLFLALDAVAVVGLGH